MAEIKLTKTQKSIIKLMRDYADRGPLTYQFIDNSIPVTQKAFNALLADELIFRRDWHVNSPALYSLTELGRTIKLD